MKSFLDRRAPRANAKYLGASLAVLAACFCAVPALAQDDIETVVVTGTSIRGIQPVGSSVIALGSAEIEKTNAQTMWQVFKEMPAISNMGQAPQGNSGGNAYNVPTIHSIGSSSSNSTLILIDGHRFSPSTIQQALMDTGIIPTNMVERVEVLADGASATYGADAVAGVINVITRRNYEGFQVTGQAGFADGYHTLNSSVLYGERWNDNQLILAASYAYGSNLRADARDYLNPNHIPQGGTNFNNFNCDPAVLQPAGSSVYYLSATATTSYPTAGSGAMCNTTKYSDLIPAELRVNGMMRFEAPITPDLIFNTDFIVGNRKFDQRSARGGLQSVAFQTGPQANPFYTNPPAYAGTANRQTIRWNADELLGPGAKFYDKSTGFNSHTSLNWNINDNWHAELMGVYGWNTSTQNSMGTLCGSCANLALNGTSNGSGSLTLPSIPGTTIAATQLPLTPGNALDVWNPAATNRTSQAVRQNLVQNVSTTPFLYDIQQYRASVDGTPFALPGGDVHVAFGAEYQRWGEQANYSRSLNTGPSYQGNYLIELNLKRTVGAAYGEVLIPIIGPDMDVPLVHKFSIDLAGRYDNYSDFGSTSNPKVAFDWELFDGLKFRGNWATSFVAPQLIQVGDPARNHQSSSAYNLDTESFTVPTAVFPSVIGLPGCTAAMASCQINASIPGIAYQGNQVPLTPATGRTWSLGFDVGSNFLIPGFTFSATLFNNNMSNMLTSTHAAEALAAPSLNMIQFFPGGMTQAQLDAAIPAFYTQSGSIPPANQLYYVLNGNVKNFLFLDIQGVDASFNYDIPTETMGNFNVGGNVTQFTIFKQHAKFNPYKFSVLGAVGANGTFAPIPTQARFHVGWTGDQMDITLFASFMGGHHNAYGSSVVPVVNTGGRLQGGDVVKSNTVFDLHAAYTLSEDNWMGSTLAGSQFYIDIANIFDKDPVFFNTGTGYDQFSGNPLGRIVSVGFRATL